MKKKLLFIAPDYYGFNEVVLQGLKEYSGYEVEHLVSNFKYKYKNHREKIYNFFLKTFSGRNLKKEKKEAYIREILNRHQVYDVLLINAPYTLTDEQLDAVLKNTKFSIAIFWDSIEKIPMQKKYLDKFDVIYSFEPDDCKKYHLKSITNFFFAESDSHNSLYDVCYLATFDDRIKETELIFKYFEENGISAKGQIFVHTPKKISIKNVEVIEKIIPFSKSYQFYLKGNIILDIAHPHQKGLSFRPYEAMGLRKKLITTNKDIANYDFYNPNNIFIIDDVYNIHIPMDFITSNYQESNPAIREKYHIKNWIKSILYGN